jgi:excisionase family DNA binding protein
MYLHVTKCNEGILSKEKSMISMDERQETRYLTPEQIARMLSVTERKIQDMLRSGVLKGVKIGKEWRVSPADLEEYLDRSKQK